MADGQVHKAMNLAGVMYLPVVFVYENNQYGEMTPAENQYHVEGFESRGETYEMPTEMVDRMSIQNIYEATERARNDDGPTLLVCETYRYQGHYESDPMNTEPTRRFKQW